MNRNDIIMLRAQNICSKLSSFPLSKLMIISCFELRKQNKDLDSKSQKRFPLDLHLILLVFNNVLRCRKELPPPSGAQFPTSPPCVSSRSNGLKVLGPLFNVSTPILGLSALRFTKVV